MSGDFALRQLDTPQAIEEFSFCFDFLGSLLLSYFRTVNFDFFAFEIIFGSYFMLRPERTSGNFLHT